MPSVARDQATRSPDDEDGAVPSAPRRRRRGLAEEVREEIARDLILSEEVAPGGLLPTEKELAARYGVSRPTIRESLLMLQQAGLVRIRHGVGSVVLHRPRTVTHGLDRLCSIETLAREVGKDVETVDLEWRETVADERIVDRLDVPIGHPVLVVQRVKLYDGERVGWLTDYVPAGVLPFDELRAEFAGSALDVLLDHPEVGAEYADADLSALNLPPDIAARLGVEAGRAAMVYDAVLRTVDGRAVDWAHGWYLPEYFRFSVRRRREIGS
jgi:DNA-binding GntR family transcriptional regulator